MPVIQGKSREAIRVAIGSNLGGVKLITSAATGSATTFLTNGLWGGTNDNLGWLQFTGPTNNDGSTARVLISAVSSGQVTLTMKNILAAALTATAAGDTAELFDMKYDPTRIHEFINQAITEVMGLAYDPEESLALHGDGRQRRFDIPSEFAMVNGIYRRTSVDSVQIHDATTEWDEAAAPTNSTRVVDTKDYKKAPASNKFTITGAFSPGLLSSKAISSLNLSGYDYVEFWIKSNLATLSTTVTLLLDDTALCAGAIETLAIPALVADTWTYVRVALSTPELDTAIISVGLNMVSDACPIWLSGGTIWINGVKAVKDETAEWAKMDARNWRVDEEARDLVLDFAPRYELLKLTGGDKPALLTADADVCEVDDQYVIARATELALLSVGGGPGTDPDALRTLASYWGGKAEMAKRNLPWQVGNRTVG